jgi:hypothetical protein
MFSLWHNKTNTAKPWFHLSFDLCVLTHSEPATQRALSAVPNRSNFLNYWEITMIYCRTVIYSGLLATLLGLSACSMKPMMRSTNSSTSASAMTTRLSGASEVPPVTSTASGTVELNLNKQTNELSWTVTYSGLSGLATGAHFHGPAMAGENAGVVVPMTGNLTSPIRGVASITAAQTADLMAGKWYVNLHTAANPNGEIRGQIPAQP